MRGPNGEAKKDKKAVGTPALGALTGGIVASEVGGVGGLGTLAGAAIGGVALHMYDKRQRSKSRQRAPAPIDGPIQDPDVAYERQKEYEHQLRREKRRRRREEKNRYDREPQNGYQSY